MKGESLELHHVTLGPFPSKLSSYNLDVALLVKMQEVKSIFSLNQWRQLNEDLEDAEIAKYIEWICLEDTDEQGYN